MIKALPLISLLSGLGSTHCAQAQVALVHLLGTGVCQGVKVLRHAKSPPPPWPQCPPLLTRCSRQSQLNNPTARNNLVLLRPPTERLAARGGEAIQIQAIKAQFERCRVALPVGSTSVSDLLAGATGRAAVTLPSL